MFYLLFSIGVPMTKSPRSTRKRGQVSSIAIEIKKIDRQKEKEGSRHREMVTKLDEKIKVLQRKCRHPLKRRYWMDHYGYISEFQHCGDCDKVLGSR